MLGILTFLGGNAFRWLFGEGIAAFNKWQEHKQELERIRLEGELAQAQHLRQLEVIREQAALGVKVIEAQRDVALDQLDAFNQAVVGVGRPTGIPFVDLWNGCIRPGLATLAALFVVASIVQRGFVLTEWDQELIGAILGIYVADRHLSKRGK